MNDFSGAWGNSKIEDTAIVGHIMCVKFSEFQLKTIRGDTHCGVTQTIDNSEWADGSTLFWFNCITSDKLTLAGFSHLLLVTKLRDADVVLVKAEHVFAVLHK